MIPILAAAVSALAPELASRGLNLLSAVFTGAADKGIEATRTMIKDQTGIDIATPDKLADADWEKLRAFEGDNTEHLAAILQLDANDVERERIAQQDRENARAMQIEALGSTDKTAQRFLYVYSLLLTVLTFGFIFWASFGHDFEAHPGSERIIDTVLGFLLGVALSAIVQFFFGSSAGSQRKSSMLARLAGDE